MTKWIFSGTLKYLYLTYCDVMILVHLDQWGFNTKHIRLR